MKGKLRFHIINFNYFPKLFKITLFGSKYSTCALFQRPKVGYFGVRECSRPLNYILLSFLASRFVIWKGVIHALPTWCYDICHVYYVYVHCFLIIGNLKQIVNYKHFDSFYFKSVELKCIFVKINVFSFHIPTELNALKLNLRTFGLHIKGEEWFFQTRYWWLSSDQ